MRSLWLRLVWFWGDLKPNAHYTCIHVIITQRARCCVQIWPWALICLCNCRIINHLLHRSSFSTAVYFYSSLYFVSSCGLDKIHQIRKYIPAYWTYLCNNLYIHGYIYIHTVHTQRSEREKERDCSNWGTLTVDKHWRGMGSTGYWGSSTKSVLLIV